jgi:hypothetical protein
VLWKKAKRIWGERYEKERVKKAENAKHAAEVKAALEAADDEEDEDEKELKNALEKGQNVPTTEIRLVEG